MDSERRIFSPARRSRRCALCLIACSVLMAITFVAIHKDRFPLVGNRTVAMTSNTATVAAPCRGALNFDQSCALNNDQGT